MDINKYYNQLQSKDIILSYKGAVSSELLDCLLKLTEDKLHNIGSKKKLKKKVYTIVVEVLQNIYHHFDPSFFESEDQDSIAFVIATEGESFNIMAGNYVSNNKVEFLSNIIDELNSLSADELKDRYRAALDNGSFTPKGGAGLGMLYIARKAGGRMEYVVHQSDVDHSFFSLKVNVRA